MPYVPGFLPSRSAPLFHNGPWPAGLDLKLSLAGLPAASVDVTQMGLCGGMSVLARDIHEAGTPQLRSTDSRSIPVPVGRHILRRLLDSFRGPGVIPYWLHATQELDHSTWFWGQGLFAETVEAARQVMRYIDAGGLVPIGVVLAQSPWPWDVFQNHVELVYGYDLVGTRLTLHVYDSNAEGSDHVVIELDIGSSAPVQPVTTNGTAIAGQAGRIRGFFVLPYTRQDPSPAYLDDGRVGIAGTQGGADGADLVVTLTVDNAGSTTFDPAAGYRIGVPPGGGDWTPDRFDLDAPLDPGRTTTQVVTLPAPAGGTTTLQLQLVRDPGNGDPPVWFGRPSDPTEVAAAVAVG
jgi:hypothetical protein